MSTGAPFAATPGAAPVLELEPFTLSAAQRLVQIRRSGAKSALGLKAIQLRKQKVTLGIDHVQLAGHAVFITQLCQDP